MSGSQLLVARNLERYQNLAWLGRWDDLVSELGNLSDDRQEYPVLSYLLAMGYEHTGRFAEAISQYKLVLKLTSLRQLVLRKIADLRERIGDTSGSADAWLELASIYESGGKKDLAEQAWAFVLRLQPSNSSARINLARAYSSAGENAKASREYVELVKITVLQGDYDASVEFARKAVDADRKDAEAKALLDGLQVLVDRLQMEGPSEQLLSRLNRFLESPFSETLLPSDQVLEYGDTDHQTPVLAVSMEDLLAVTGSDVSPLQAMMTGDSDSAEISKLLSSARQFEEQNQLEEAIVIYQQMIQSGVDHLAVVYGLGRAYWKAARYRDSLRMLSMVASREEVLGPVQLILGLCQVGVGQIKPAKEQLAAGVRAWLETAHCAEDPALLMEGAAALAHLYEKAGDTVIAAPLLTSVIQFLQSIGEKQKAESLEGHLTHLTLAAAKIGESTNEIPVEDVDVLADSIANCRDYIAQGLFLAAVDECLNGICLHPGYLPTHIALAEVYTAMNLTNDAVEKYKAIVDVCLVRGDVSRAIDMYQRVLKITPEDAVVHSRLSYLLSEQNETNQESN